MHCLFRLCFCVRSLNMYICLQKAKEEAKDCKIFGCNNQQVEVFLMDALVMASKVENREYSEPHTRNTYFL